MGARWSTQTFRQAGETQSGPEAFLDFCFLKTRFTFSTQTLSPVHTKPTVGHRAVFVRRPTKFSQCVPHRRLKLVFVGFFSADLTC